jgi:hypothetical protein
MFSSYVLQLFSNLAKLENLFLIHSTASQPIKQNAVNEGTFILLSSSQGKFLIATNNEYYGLIQNIFSIS